MRVITFSTKFPVSHPRKGQSTYFVEKIWNSLIETGDISLSKCCELSRHTGIGNLTMNSVRKFNPIPKHHTIGAGHRWKVGDKFSPRVWSGKPYASKQIEFAPPIEIKKVWDFEIRIIQNGFTQPAVYVNEKLFLEDKVSEIAKNDGLNYDDFESWFIPGGKIKAFVGQILCWNESIDYLQPLPNSLNTVQESG